MINRKFIENLNTFKESMLSDDIPSYVIRYCEQLNEVKWIWFYVQMMEAVIITEELDYLFYVLKWILKTDFHDLAYEMYFYDMINPECSSESLIKDEYRAMYSQRYHTQFMEDLSVHR
ncbi:hypothetical protein [Clostridium beijerinckii]|jgi:hypothetical protein|nr:hypothetical protein [Clostridium beijerinckii]MCI1581588.1 hypothetical protein [Clostridium beijerinckii]MCI1625162.1 hypothetical protein [Clostridium beijerinckii]MDG5857200.1 hypothetical protein [Clostridium beijerinckii]NOW31005.1 hypothetical protein [Clostridium beijerinckii]NOW84043.1 hypothetical protein [Clostridium beijerinckii]